MPYDTWARDIRYAGLGLMIRAGQGRGQRSDCGGGEALWACLSGGKSGGDSGESGADSGKNGARGGGHDSQWRSVAQGWRSSMRGPE